MEEKPFDSQNAAYAQALYEEFARNPDAVPEEWRRFFALGPAAAREAGLIVPESLAANGGGAVADASVSGAGQVQTETLHAVQGEADTMRRLLPVVARATSFVQAYRDHGHHLSRIDPLGSPPPGHPQLDPSFFGTSMEELEELPASLVMEGVGDESLAHALKRLQSAYCGTIGYEFEHLEDPSVVRWLWDQVESGVHAQPMTEGDQVRLLQRLAEVEELEQFVHKAYLGQKRFSIEGTDVMVPMMDLALEEAARDGAERVVLGMAHRGRLNVLAHFVGVGYQEIIREFEGIEAKGAFTVEGTGDVKYHHGAEGERSLPDGSLIRITLVPNPSHLEFVNPVVQGMARALQHGSDQQDTERNTAVVVPILIHGDAAFAGEGIVAETLNLGRLKGYTTGGTVHLIANNQIGFTTLPADDRSTRYASDLAKGFSFPIIHVNADDAEACMTAVRLAMAYRAEYHDDVVIDLVGYRRYGHNEGDEAGYTQPLETKRIKEHPTVRAVYAERLVAEGVLSDDDVEAITARVSGYLRDAQDEVQSEERSTADVLEDSNLDSPHGTIASIPLDILVEVNAASVASPEGFTVHPKLERQLVRRDDGFGPEFSLDWGHAEALAFGSLLWEGVPVRLTGQDSQRGTFSHRHLVLHDSETGQQHTPLSEYGKARFTVHNSPLSEMAVLGFEYGYSVASEKDLALWEAQFGDFANAAQVSIDQFVSSGWEKWGQVATLAMLLPHGYEGQGPEHSSARLERFLQLCAEDNMRVVSPTTPAQYYHLLRRQAHVRPERPLVIMTPKSLLRHPRATSTVSDLVEGSFHTVLDDPAVGEAEAVTRLLLCSGKLYYDLAGSELREDQPGAAIVRLEELYPFPGSEVEEILARYPSVREVVWTQEEPRNMGALSYVGPRLRAVVPRELKLSHVARPERASPAEGKHIGHVVEQARVIRESFKTG
jgi:2-oxoglutarate dehydrogenase E1 component